MVAILAGLVASVTAALRYAAEERVLKVYSPLRFFLGESPVLVDPSDLKFTYEYYLLENLSVGLLRDDPDTSSGYGPILATEWEQMDAHSWRFKIREDLRWSDGTSITLDQIAAHFEEIRHRPGLHLQHLRALEMVGQDNATNSLILRFAHAVNNDMLHELALADTVLLHPLNKSGDWTVTSGPFRVERVAIDGKRGLWLVANPRCPLKSNAGIERVFLSQDSQNADFDVRILPPLAFRNEVRDLVSHAARVHTGIASRVYFFRFGSQHPLVTDRGARLQFAAIAREAFSGFGTDQQLLPPGFPGHLKKPPRVPVGTSLNGQTLTLVWDRRLQANNVLAEHLQTVGNRMGVRFQHIYQSVDSLTEETAAFAVLTNFVGNQKDPLGSFSFLFADNGPLSPFGAPAAESMHALVTQPHQRVRRFEALHSQILAEAWLVPVFSEPHSLLASSRVDLSRVSPFNHRLRFYEIAWQ